MHLLVSTWQAFNAFKLGGRWIENISRISHHIKHGMMYKDGWIGGENPMFWKSWVLHLVHYLLRIGMNCLVPQIQWSWSTPQNTKSVSLKPLVEHFYLEDKWQAIMQLAALQNVKEAKSSRKLTIIMCSSLRKERNWCSVICWIFWWWEYWQDATKWYKGTIVAYSKQGHTVSLNGYGPEHNEIIKSLRKRIERGEAKLL